MRFACNALQGGQLVWIAPSGGRDRPDAEGNWLPAHFDGSAVELMRTLLTKAAPDGHLYPFAMSSFAIMPPPQVSLRFRHQQTGALLRFQAGCARQSAAHSLSSCHEPAM